MKINSKFLNLIYIFIILGVFFTGYFLGNIDFDLNPKGKDIEYKVEVSVDRTYNISVSYETFDNLEEGNTVFFNISGLNESAYYFFSKVAFGEFDKSIDGYSIDFTNRSSLLFSLDVQKTNAVLLENKTTSLLWLVEVWIYEEITSVDIIRAIPRLSNFDLLSMFIGFITGSAINIWYFVVRNKLKEKLGAKLQNIRGKESD